LEYCFYLDLQRATGQQRLLIEYFHFENQRGL
jgi:hypothetical protein